MKFVVPTRPQERPSPTALKDKPSNDHGQFTDTFTATAVVIEPLEPVTVTI